VKPVLHVQTATDVLEMGELELVGHPIQVVATVAPTVVEYVPAPQSVHTECKAISIVNLPAAHVTHVVLEDVLEIFPSSQNKHVLAPRAG